MSWLRPAVTGQPPTTALPEAASSRDRSFAEPVLNGLVQERGRRPKSHHGLFSGKTQEYPCRSLGRPCSPMGWHSRHQGYENPCPHLAQADTNPPLPHPGGLRPWLAVLLESAHPPSTRSAEDSLDLPVDRSPARSSARAEQRTRTSRKAGGNTLTHFGGASKVAQPRRQQHGAPNEMHKRSLAQPGLPSGRARAPLHSLSVPRDTHRNQCPQPARLLAASRLPPTTNTD